MQKIKLSIPDPCQENWDNMTPGHQGRFCNSCAKTVIDFSQMSDPEVLNYFSRVKNEKVCGRMYPDQLDRAIQSLPTKTFLWRWNYIIAFFLFFTKAGAAKSPGGTVKQTLTQPGFESTPLQNRGDTLFPTSIMPGEVAYGQTPAKLTISKPVPAPAKIMVKATVTNETGETIPGASVSILPGTRGLLADDEGNFKVMLVPGKDNLRVSAVGYETQTVPVLNKREQTIVLKSVSLQLDEVILSGSAGTMKGGIIMMGGMTRTRSYSITDTIKNFLSPAQCSINIYPNPVQKGSVANITLKLKNGMYNLQVLDANGQLLLQKQVNSTTGKIFESLEIPPTWSSGNYFIHVSDGKGKKAGSGGFVVTR